MKKLIFGMMVLIAAQNAFSAEHRIDCISDEKNVQIGVIGADENFTEIKTLVVLDDRTAMGEGHTRIEDPQCSVDQRPTEDGLFLVIRCEKQKILVNQWLKPRNIGSAMLIGRRTAHLECKSN